MATPEALLSATVRMSVPLLFAAQGEVLAERAGIMNIGLEGMMLVGAFAGAAGAAASGSPWTGLLVGMAAGAALAAGLGVLVIYRGANQVVAGLAVNMLALGLTGVLHHAAAQRAAGAPIPAPTFQPIALGPLASLPVLGPALFQVNALAYLAFFVTPLLAFFLYRTRPGLRLRAVGEYPLAAETAGANVGLTRLLAVTACGALAGAGGVFLAIGHLDRFGENMVAGRGFIALAIVILGRWNPWGALAATLFFGLAQALQLVLGAGGSGLPYQLFLALPYLATLVALLVRFGAARPPASLAVPYHRS